MLLSLRDKLTVVVAPDGLNISLRKKGWRSPVKELGYLAVTVDSAREDTDAVLKSLDAWLAQTRWKWTDVDVVISDAFTKYLVLPWSEGFHKTTEIAALARIHFDVLFGASEAERKVQFYFEKYGQDGVACAVRLSLLTALKEVFFINKIRVTSIEPRFIQTFNIWRYRLAGNGLLVSVEQDLCVMAIVRDGLWGSIRTLKLNGNTPLALQTTIDREIILQGESEQTRVYLDLHAAIDVSSFAQQDRFQLLGRGLHRSAVPKQSAKRDAGVTV